MEYGKHDTYGKYGQNNKSCHIYAICVAVLLILTVFISSAQDVQAATGKKQVYKDIVYKTVNNGKEVQITGYRGRDEKVVIPNKIAGKKVTSIGVKAFAANKNVTMVIIPDSVKRINAYALGYRSNRKKIKAFTIQAKVGSAAYRYAIYNDVNFNVAGLSMGKVYTERLKSDETKLTWNKAKCNGYEVYRSESADKAFKKVASVADNTSYTDTGLKSGRKYYYEVKPYILSGGRKCYGNMSKAVVSIWGKYNTATFKNVNRDKKNMEEKQGVYYEIFVRSFADSNGDGIGDFRGITEKMDYLKELGIDGIWLMPITASNSYHGYDVTDYTSVNWEYGSEQDFIDMINAAHEHGIKVIMDFVINHTSSEHYWFKDALNNVNSPYRDYYRFVSKYDTTQYNVDDMSPWGSNVWVNAGDYYYYSAFYGMMPDLNYNNPKVRKEIKSAASKWLNLGVDGFRLDAAMHIYGDYEFRSMSDKQREDANIQWWNEFARYCEGINPSVYLVGEAWQNDEVLERYAQPFDTKFNFAFEQNMIQSVKDGRAVLENGTTLSDSLENILKAYSDVDTKYIDGIFGSNHDQNRIMSTMEGNKEKAQLVASIYMTLPGNPYMYYGEELGMKGSGMDENKRTPFLWGKDNKYNTSWEEDENNTDTASYEEQKTDDTSMYVFYKNLIRKRKSSKALMYGEYKAIATDNDAVMAYTRSYENEKVTVIHNLSDKAVSVNISGENVDVEVYGTVIK